MLQAEIEADVDKRTFGLVVLPPPSMPKPKTKTVKTADVAPEDDGVSQASGSLKGAKRRRKHAERATEVEGLSHRFHVFEEAFKGPATSSGHRNPPRHMPDFEKIQLFYVRPDFPHSWLFPAHS